MKKLEIGSVYLWNNKLYVYIKRQLFTKQGELVYELAKVNPSGYLSGFTFRKYRPNEFKLTNNVKVEIKIVLPKVDTDKLKYEELVENVHIALQKSKFGDLSKKEAKRILVLNCLTAITYYNQLEERQYNLRDFAKSLEMKKYTKAYLWIASTMKDRVRQDLGVYKEMSDRTLIMIFNNYKKYFKSLTGFNKELDTIIKSNLKNVINEIKEREI